VITTEHAPGIRARQNRVAIWKRRLFPDPVGMVTIKPAPDGMVSMARIADF
jgi:hypothetical protein